MKYLKNFSQKNSAVRSGFTLIELLVSLAIFAFMTAFLLSKYGTFNQDTLLTNVAYDIALSIRSAQSYGLNVLNAVNDLGVTISCSQYAGYSTTNQCFYYAYGVHFDTTVPNRFILFVDLNTGLPTSGVYVPNDSPVEDISVYTMNKGYSVQSICAGASSGDCVNMSTLDITFKRPNPDAIIDGTPVSGSSVKGAAYGKIVLTANGLTKSVVIQSTGQISITN